jgi:hypothetical protein
MVMSHTSCQLLYPTMFVVSCVGPETNRLGLAYETSEIPYLPLAIYHYFKELQIKNPTSYKGFLKLTLAGFVSQR